MTEKRPKGAHRMNLAKERRHWDWPTLVFTALLLLGMLGRGAALHLRLRDALAALETAESARDRAAAAAAEDPELTAAYGRLVGGAAVEESAVDRMAVLALLEEKIMPAAAVRSFRLSGNTASLQLGGMTLEEVGLLLDELLREELVSDVSVSNAGGSDGAVTVSIAFDRGEARP